LTISWNSSAQKYVTSSIMHDASNTDSELEAQRYEMKKYSYLILSC